MVVAAAGLPSMRLDNASSTERSVGRSRRLATGIDALATHPRVAEISAGGTAGRRRGAAGPHYSLGRRRGDCEPAARADGPPDQFAGAVRADAVQDVLRTVAAPRALVRADEHVRGCWVEVPVTAFPIRTQL